MLTIHNKIKSYMYMIFSIVTLTMFFGASFAYAEFKCPKTGGIFKTVDLAYPSMDAGVRANPVYYSFLIYDSLLDMTYDLSVAPGLASEVPKKNADGSYTFNLRKGVKFHDGSEFNAEAVAFNVDRLKSGKIASPYSGVWKKFLKSYDIIDSNTIKFTPNGEWPTFLWDVAASLRIASPKAVKNAGRDYGTKVAVGTGPFVMKSFKAKDHLHLDRNPNYYRKGLPCLGGFKAKLISSGSVRILKLKKGELDTINTFPESQFPQFKGSNLILQEGKASTFTLIPMNTKNPVLKKKKIRQAIQYAINGKELIDNVYRGAGEEVESIFPPWHPAFIKAEDLSKIRQNTAKAKQLLKEEGYGPGGKKLKLKMLHGTGGAHVQRAVLIQAQLKAAGIDLSIVKTKMGALLKQMYTGKYELALWQMLGGPTIQEFTWNMYHSGGSSNPSYYNKEGGYQNPEAEKLLDEIVKTNDPAVAKPSLIKLQKIIFDDVPVAFANWRNHRTVRNPWVKNFKTGKLKGMEDLRKVWLDK